MNEYKEKKKFKHKFLVFIIILIVINVALIPFTYKAFKSFATTVNPTPVAPVVEEYNYSDQEFVNIVVKTQKMMKSIIFIMIKILLMFQHF